MLLSRVQRTAADHTPCFVSYDTCMRCGLGIERVVNSTALAIANSRWMRSGAAVRQCMVRCASCVDRSSRGFCATTKEGGETGPKVPWFPQPRRRTGGPFRTQEIHTIRPSSSLLCFIFYCILRADTYTPVLSQQTCANGKRDDRLTTGAIHDRTYWFGRDCVAVHQRTVDHCFPTTSPIRHCLWRHWMEGYSSRGSEISKPDLAA